MRAKQNLAQPFASKEAGLRALEFHFLEFLAAFPFKLRFGKRGFTRQLLHKVKQRFRKFRQAAKRNSTRVRPSVCGEVRADAPQVFFDLAAGALPGARPKHRSEERRVGKECRSRGSGE